MYSDSYSCMILSRGVVAGAAGSLGDVSGTTTGSRSSATDSKENAFT